MKPHTTNQQHQKFSSMLEDYIKKMEEIPNEAKIQVLQKITELQNNKQALDEIYANYQLKLKELGYLLDNYETTQQIARINLRKIQLWFKFTYSKVMKVFF